MMEDKLLLKAIGLPVAFQGKKDKRSRKRKRRNSEYSNSSSFHNCIDTIDEFSISECSNYIARHQLSQEHFYFDDESPTKRSRTIPDIPVERPNDMPEDVPSKLAKYWNQRYKLFSKFDQGILMDEEGWYSATPQGIAKHIAERCACSILVDPFCGVGGNLIQFALTCERVIAIDSSVKRLRIARNNCKVYGVEDRVEFIAGDAFKLLPTLIADVVFLAPPWGGPSYEWNDGFKLEDMAVDAVKLFECAKKVTRNIAYYLPRNIHRSQVVFLSRKDEFCEIETNYFKKKVKSVTAYYGDLVTEIDE